MSPVNKKVRSYPAPLASSCASLLELTPFPRPAILPLQEYPSYALLVKNPIHFNLIKNKINKNGYKNVQQAHADFVSPLSRLLLALAFSLPVRDFTRSSSLNSNSSLPTPASSTSKAPGSTTTPISSKPISRPSGTPTSPTRLFLELPEQEETPAEEARRASEPG